MAEVADAYVSLKPSARGFGRGIERELGGDLDRAGRSGGRRFGAGMTGALGGIGAKVFAPLAAAAAGVGILSFFKSAVTGASDTAESMSKVGVVFGKSAGTIKAFAATAATSLGLSTQAALEAAGSLGNLFVALKLPQAQAATMSKKMVTLAGDLASFNNVPVEDALAALKSGLVGETEPLRAFGVNMNDATLRDQAFRAGLIKTTKDAMSPAVKAQAAYALILAQTGTAQGDFARTSSGLANQQRILAAKFTDLKARIGQQLLPTIVSLANFASTRLLPGLERVAGIVSSKLGPAFAAASPAIARFFTSPAMQQYGAYIQGTLIPVIQRIAAQILPAAVAAFNNVRAAIERNRPQLLQLWEGLKTVADFVVTRVLPVLGPILAGTLQAMGMLIRNAITTIANLVTAFNFIRAVVIAAVARIRAVWQAFWTGPFGAFARAGFSLLVNVVRVGIALVIASTRTVVAVIGLITGPFRAAVSGARAAIGALVGLTSGIRGRIAGALGNLGSLLYNAGKAVVEGLIRGIASKLSGLANMAKKLADTIAKVVPGSPVREGPLKVLNRGYAGGRIATMLADGINAKAGAVNAAMRSALAVPGAAASGSAGSGGLAGGDMVAAIVAALSLLSWQIDPQGVARLVRTGERSLTRRG